MKPLSLTKEEVREWDFERTTNEHDEQIEQVLSLLDGRDALFQALWKANTEASRLREALASLADAAEELAGWTECRCIQSGCDHDKASDAITDARAALAKAGGK